MEFHFIIIVMEGRTSGYADGMMGNRLLDFRFWVWMISNPDGWAMELGGIHPSTFYLSSHHISHQSATTLT